VDSFLYYDCRVTVFELKFVLFNTGKLKPAGAFMTGKLKISGNLQKAMKLEKLMGMLKSKL
jgi:putative sterol carrier protein